MQTSNTFKHVTNRQGVTFAELARKNKISREVLRKFLDDKERQVRFFEELKNGDAFVSEFFKKSSSLTLLPVEGEWNVARDVAKLLPTKQEGGKLDYRDSDIVNWFGNVTVSGRKEKVNSSLYRFKQNLTHQEIISHGEKLKVYKSFNIFDACELTGKLIDTGEVEAKNTGVVIYLQEKYNGNQCRLSVWRDDAGRLRVYAYCVNPDDEWDAGRGVLFS
jgi:hypothetical protein